MFTFRKKHFELRARISPLARLIHEYFASDERYHEPSYHYFSIEALANEIRNAYGKQVSPKFVESAMEELFFSDLISTKCAPQTLDFSSVISKPGLVSVAKFTELPNDDHSDLYREIWQHVERDASTRRIESLIKEAGIEEVRRQVGWFRYRNSAWCQSPYNALVSYCRDKLPEPLDLAREKEEERKKRVDAEDDARYNEYRAKKLADFELSDTDKMNIIEEARRRCGQQYTNDSSFMMKAMIRMIMDDMAGVISKKEWLVKKRMAGIDARAKISQDKK